MRPSDEILEFLQRQSPNIVNFLCWQIRYFVSNDLAIENSDIADLRSHLFHGDDHKCFISSIVVIGVAEYILTIAANGDSLADLQTMAEHFRSDNLASIIREQPFRLKLFQNALDEWRSLREGALSFEALRKYERTLLAKAAQNASGP